MNKDDDVGEEDTLRVDNNKEDARENGKFKDTGFFLFSARWRLCNLLFVTFALLYMHRVNLSLAVVCMVNSPESPTTLKAVIQENHTEAITVNDEGVDVKGNSSLSNIGRVTAEDTDNSSQGFGLNGPCHSIKTQQDQTWKPELSWQKSDLSVLLSSYFYGSFFTQVPAGRLSDRFGGKHIMTVTMVVTMICSMLTPVCARTSIYLMFAIRIMIGLAGGAVIPVGIAMISVWAPPKERSSMLAFTGCGFFFGTIISNLTSGFLCAYGFDNGWPSIFYIHGGLSFIFICAWLYDAHSTPGEHPRISRAEMQHIQTSITHSAKKPPENTPWLSIFTSRPMWASIISHFAFNWSFFTVLINIPLFLKEVLKFDIQENGLYSALPYIFCMLSTIPSTKLANWLITKKILGHLATRRIFSAVNMLGFATCLVCAGHVTCENRHVGVILLCLSTVFGGLAYGGWLSNHTEFSGQYSGTTFGITNAGGVISSLLASMSAVLLTPNGLQEEWQTVFYIAAGIDLIGALVFVTCSSVELQPWAVIGLNLDYTIDIPATTQGLQTFDITENGDKNV